jgi:putative oxidoreductase
MTVAILVGFIFTRPAAMVIAFEVCMATYLVLGTKAFELNRQTGAPNGELQFFYIFTAIAIASLGSGRYALSKAKGRWD